MSSTKRLETSTAAGKWMSSTSPFMLFLAAHFGVSPAGSSRSRTSPGRSGAAALTLSGGSQSLESEVILTGSPHLAWTLQSRDIDRFFTFHFSDRATGPQAGQLSHGPVELQGCAGGHDDLAGTSEIGPLIVRQ